MVCEHEFRPIARTSATGFQNNVTEAAIFSTTPVSATQAVTLPYNQTGVTTDLLACKNLVPSSSNRMAHGAHPLE